MVKPIIETGHSEFLNRIALSQDLKFMLTGDAAQFVILWDYRSNLILHRFEIARVGKQPPPNFEFSPIENLAAISSRYTGTFILNVDQRKQVWNCSDLQFLRFSRDGKYILLTRNNENILFYDLHTGNLIKTLDFNETIDPNSVDLSSNNQLLMVGFKNYSKKQYKLTLWDLTKEKWVRDLNVTVPSILRDLNVQVVPIIKARFSSDGKLIAASTPWGITYLWEKNDSRPKQVFLHNQTYSNPPSPGERIYDIAFNPGKPKYLVSASGLSTPVKVWNIYTGEIIKSIDVLRAHGETHISSVTFTMDAKHLLVGGSRREISIYETKTWKEVRRIGKRVYESVTNFSMTPNGNRFIVSYYDGPTHLHDGRTGNFLQAFQNPTYQKSIITPDGKYVFHDNDVYDVRLGQKVEELLGGISALSRDGKFYAIAINNPVSEIRILRVGTWSTFKTISDVRGHINCIAISSDGNLVAAAVIDMESPSYPTALRIWNIDNGNSYDLSENNSIVSNLEFSEDGDQLLVVDYNAKLWDMNSRRKKRDFRLVEISGSITPIGNRGMATFSRNGKSVLTTSKEGKGYVWDIHNEDKKPVELKGHKGPMTSIGELPHSGFYITGGQDGTIRVWSKEGKEIFQHIAFKDNAWAVVDPKGRYDASNPNDITGLHWVAGNEIVLLSQMKDKYWVTDLSSKLLGGQTTDLPEVESFQKLALFPKVDAVIENEVETNAPQLKIKLKNQGGGIGKVVVKINGTERNVAAPQNPNAENDTQTFPLKDDPYLIPNEKNTIKVLAYNGLGEVATRGSEVFYTPKSEKKPAPFKVYAIIAGVSKYEGSKLKLSFADNDARAFYDAFKMGAEELVKLDPQGHLDSKDRVNISLFVSSENIDDAEIQSISKPTKINLKQTFLNYANQIKSQDIFVVYFSGHGIVEEVAGKNGKKETDYYYLTKDAKHTNLQDLDHLTRNAWAIAGQELRTWITEIQAKKKVMILDTCASGQAINVFSQGKAPRPNIFKAIDRVNSGSGIHILAGSAANKESYEASVYGQGLLTYSLLEGMKGPGLLEQHQVNVGKLFDRAEERVRDLAKFVGGIQKPQSFGKGNFNIGYLHDANKENIRLSEIRPVFVKSRIAVRPRGRDKFQLERKINASLEGLGKRGRDSPLVFFHTEEFPKAYQIIGEYSWTGGEIQFDYDVYKGESCLKTFNESAPIDKIEELVVSATRSTESFIKMVKNHKPSCISN